MSVESTKGASYEKFLVMACDGKEVLDTALTLQEATTKLADLVEQDACFVMKILRTTEKADPIEAFRVRDRPRRLVQVAEAAPPHVDTDHEPEEEEVEEPEPKPRPKKVEKEKPKKKGARRPKTEEEPGEEHRVPAEI